ncbi:MAG: glycosyltransferase, partial [Devosia sp.]
IAAVRPDDMHVHNFFPTLSPSIFDAADRLGIPSVMTLHNFRIVCPTAFLFLNGKVNERSLGSSTWWAVPHRVYRGSLVGTAVLCAVIEWHKWRGTWRRQPSVFVALTEFAKAKFAQAGLPAERFVVKQNAVIEPHEMESVARSGALYVGRLSEEKGIELLMRAWRSIETSLTVVGSGPLEDLVRNRAVSMQVTPLGHLDRQGVEHRMRQAEFLVMPSVCYEMFPVTLAEAFSHGLPVIASRLGSLAELVVDQETGLHFDHQDPDDLRRKVLWASDHPLEMREMGRRARKVYEERYSERVNVERLIEVYRGAGVTAQ